jgi:hypothetical protein
MYYTFSRSTGRSMSPLGCDAVPHPHFIRDARACYCLRHAALRSTVNRVSCGVKQYHIDPPPSLVKRLIYDSPSDVRPQKSDRHYSCTMNGLIDQMPSTHIGVERAAKTAGCVSQRPFDLVCTQLFCFGLLLSEPRGEQ